jgi:predicted tellurium resistance membrane protein TerC
VFLASIAGIFTLVKWLFAGATILLLLTGLAMAIRNRFKVQA